MKMQIIKCKTCGIVFSACVDEHADSHWYRECAKYLANGNSIVETIESDGNVFNGELGKCCGKKVKPIISDNQTKLI